ncbi:hypothetical protein Ddye_009683 [Dipteronia dyeriana]|uniref:Reverse transcriptase domain-containing protein n=1 Tax=Dipteronia dyeriana TaxID=168575 RepID=A0AAD9XCG5_9ROSI|nr:hypothetical protein Ddye_009683 [Dipteronia dyeriana]
MVKWLKEGDNNSKFFHCIANNRRRNNYIGEIVIKGNRILDPSNVKNGIHDFFKNHFKNVSWKRPSISSLDLKVLAKVDRENLEKPFNEEEVWKTVNGCDGNKASGPDGLNPSFVEDNWVSIKDDFMNFIKGFHDDRAIVKDKNNIFIALIPKCGTPESFSDYRPISLIIDNFMVVEEIIHSWKRDKEGGLIIKIDFEKAYDNVDHVFLDSMMKGSPMNVDWAEIFHCKQVNLPITYLGLPLGAKPFSKVVASLYVEGSSSEKILQRGLKNMLGNGLRSTFWDIDTWESGQLRWKVHGKLFSYLLGGQLYG